MSKSTCPHIEAILPQMRDGDFPQIISGDMAAAHTMSVFQVMLPSFSKDDFLSTMRSFGFTEDWDLELLELKYYYGLSDTRVAKELSYISRQTVTRRLRQLHTLLKERGYKRRGKK